MGLRLSECEALMENYQAQPYGLRNFVNMVRIEEYQEGSVHTVQEGGSSSSSSIASLAPSTLSSSIVTMKKLSTI